MNSADFSALQTKAEGGNADAQFQLGKAYETGNGMTQNNILAFAWYKKAAEQGNPAAENSLGIMYRLGLGVGKDKEEAVRWYRKAARIGNPEAMFNLSASYYNGDGVPDNPIFACAWFFLAQEGGNSLAQDAVRRCSSEMGKRSTVDVVLQIGAMYERGADLPQSYAEAAKWYRKEAAKSPEAALRLATLLIRDVGPKSDYGEAMDLCSRVAKEHNARAQYCVGYLHQHGLGVAPDSREAAKWYGQAAVQGNTPAALTLAEMYLKGDGVAVDRPEAFCLLYLASRNGVQGARSKAHSLRQEMNKDEIKRTEKELRGKNLDPKKVFQIVDDLAPPDATLDGSSPR